MEIKYIIKTGLDLTKRTLDRTLDGLTAEELKWQPKNDANSIGLILFHVIRTEDSMVHRIQGKPQIWETAKWYQKFNKAIDDGGAHYTAEQVHNFVVPDMKEMMNYAAASPANGAGRETPAADEAAFRTGCRRDAVFLRAAHRPACRRNFLPPRPETGNG